MFEKVLGWSCKVFKAAKGTSDTAQETGNNWLRENSYQVISKTTNSDTQCFIYLVSKTGRSSNQESHVMPRTESHKGLCKSTWKQYCIHLYSRLSFLFEMIPCLLPPSLWIPQASNVTNQTDKTRHPTTSLWPLPLKSKAFAYSQHAHWPGRSPWWSLVSDGNQALLCLGWGMPWFLWNVLVLLG